jgi:hypothetical protein
MTHILDPQEVLIALQEDAIDIHTKATYLGNNLSNPATNDEIHGLANYSVMLGSIEEQINQLFNY